MEIEALMGELELTSGCEYESARWKMRWWQRSVREELHWIEGRRAGRGGGSTNMLRFVWSETEMVVAALVVLVVAGETDNQWRLSVTFLPLRSDSVVLAHPLNQNGRTSQAFCFITILPLNFTSFWGFTLDIAVQATNANVTHNHHTLNYLVISVIYK